MNWRRRWMVLSGLTMFACAHAGAPQGKPPLPREAFAACFKEHGFPEGKTLWILLPHVQGSSARDECLSSAIPAELFREGPSPSVHVVAFTQFAVGQEPADSTRVDGHGAFKVTRSILTRPVVVMDPPLSFNPEGAEGDGEVKCTVLVTGQLSNCRVLQAVPGQDLLGPISTWRAKPATLDGVPFELDYVARLRFRL